MNVSEVIHFTNIFTNFNFLNKFFFFSYFRDVVECELYCFETTFFSIFQISVEFQRIANIRSPEIRLSCAHVRILAFEYKNALSVLHVHMLICFRKFVHNKALERSTSKCM